MEFSELMHAYFRGERIEALFFIVPAGLVLLGLAATALAVDRGGFGWGLAVPLALFGLLALGVGSSVGLRTHSQVAELDEQYRADPAQMVAQELPRMEQVNRNWPIYITSYAVLVVVGLALRFGIHADWAHGLGPGLILIAAAGFLIDGFAERRARPYTAALEAMAAEHGVTGGPKPSS